MNEDESEKSFVQRSQAMKYWRFGLISAFTITVGALASFILSSLDNTRAYEGTELSGEASDFQLTDHNGSNVRLSDFRGKVVVMTFMDSQCKDTCPITGAHFRQAYGQLDQNEVKQVVFLGVNVNVEANTVADVLEATRAWHMDEIPSWHFLTGSRQDLEPVWKDYSIAVQLLPDASAIMHTPGIFIIDPSGQKRWYISTPLSELRDTELALPLNELLVKRVREIL